MKNFFNLFKKMAAGLTIYAADLAVIGEKKVTSLPPGETVQLKTLWQDKQTLVVFFRRWGCMLCRLWAKELSEITPILRKNGVRVIGVGVEEMGYQEFLENKYFDGELYYVEDLSTYQELGFKKFGTISILSSLLWKQSRDAISKGRAMELGGDTKGDWGQTGGALLIDRDGQLLNHFVQTGPADHLSNLAILKFFGLSNEYNAETMANKNAEDRTCTIEKNP